jgi:2-polyprenyl-3-methyl-5-hydroxy-6-metoxy-1,4-benzoquinol methylase
MKAFVLLFCISICAAMLCAFYSIKKSSPYYIQIVGKSDANTSSQVFFDIGNSYIEENSVKQEIRKQKVYEKFIMPLPIKKIHGLRFDPLDCIGSLEIKSISVLGKEKVGNQHKVLHEFDLKSLKAVQQVDLVMNDGGNVIATTHNDCNDPIIELPFKEPLDHWQMSDFLGLEWLSKSAFFAFLITPITLALSLSKKKKKDSDEKIIFEIKNVKRSIDFGESFRTTSENCYQDTKEENIRRIIEKIQNGTPWKQAVREKFEANNPWLYDIVTSNKRTKFLDDFIKPNNLQILDIGAGWGQFSIPLAKSNKVCSLEPTPERLNIIKSIAQQEKVSDNMYFIGTDYLDIEFQTKFDLILCIGVLEWMGSFRKQQSAGKVQSAFLKKSRSELSDKGKLVIGIENRLGLKYIMGARDDHHGFQDVMIYGEDFAERFFGGDYVDARRCIVHSLPEYEEMLRSAGFQNIKFFVAVPDYKLVEEIFPITESGSSYNDFLNKGNWIIEHDGIDGSPLPNQEKLQHLYKSLAKMNIAHLFAPSFFIEAS